MFSDVSIDDLGYCVRGDTASLSVAATAVYFAMSYRGNSIDANAGWRDAQIGGCPHLSHNGHLEHARRQLAALNYRIAWPATPTP